MAQPNDIILSPGPCFMAPMLLFESEFRLPPWPLESLFPGQPTWPPYTAVAHTGPKASWDVWHQRFGHIGVLGLKMLHTKRMVTGLDVDPGTATNSDCSSCIAAKLSRTPFPLVNESRAKFAGEKTHRDIWGPYCTASLQGSTYFVTFIDDYSRQLKINFLKKKSEAKQKIIDYINWLKNNCKRPPRTLKVDQGSEFLQRDVQDFLLSRGMVLEVTAPYPTSNTAQQSGLTGQSLN